MYHYISKPPRNADPIRLDLSVPPTQFAEHLVYLRAEGYTSITLSDLAFALEQGRELPPKPIILTFDDGYRDHYWNAYPLLRIYGFKGTFFLITSVIDQENPNYLSWAQVSEMSAGGMDMEAHGYTHTDLRGRSVDYLVWQVLGAKEAIEARTHKPVRFFCYPSGSYDEKVVAVLRSAHYWGAVTTQFGWEHHTGELFALKRVRIHGRYTAEDLAKILEGIGAGEAQP